ncbi:hypothetical protein [Streptomyces collinus]|uniref:hypothetical protein n=1 Tax=Streptomyces collinus TaxID=42684 RepID=UPI0038230F0E
MDQLEQLRHLRLTTREVILRWLVLTPADTSDLAPLLTDASVDREHRIDRLLHDFLAATPQEPAPDIVPGG